MGHHSRWRYDWNTVRRCNLYDRARHVWTDYERRVTSAPVVACEVFYMTHPLRAIAKISAG